MPIRHRARAAARLTLVALLAGLPAVAGGQRHALRGGDVALYNVAGRVRLVPGTGGEVVVEVSRQGRDAARLGVATGEIGGRQTLRVLYPDDAVVYRELGRWSRSRTRIRDDGTFGDAHGARASGGTREIEVRGDGRGTEAWADLTVAVPAGQRLALHLVAGEATIANVDGDLTIDVHSASVAAERVKGRLVIDAGSGAVRVDGAEGEVSLDTGSGAAELRAIRGPRLTVDAGSGSLTGSDIDVATVTLDLGSGRTRLGALRTRTLRIDAGSGGVDVGLLGDVDDARIDTGSGSVTLRLPASLGAELEIDTGSGGITTEIPVTVTSRARDRLVGRIGDGRGRIVIDTGSGGVRLLRG